MANFPVLTPNSRTFTPGTRPHSNLRSFSGLTTRVRQSNIFVNQRLRLAFVALSEAEMLSIRSHYIGQQGPFLSFSLPTEILAGTDSPSAFVGTGYTWAYADPPTVSDLGRHIYAVSVELVSVAPVGTNVSGAEWAVTISVETGGATGSAETAPGSWTVNTGFEGGIGAGPNDVFIPVTSFGTEANPPTQSGPGVEIFTPSTALSLASASPVVATVVVIPVTTIALNLQALAPASPSDSTGNYFSDMSLQIWGWERIAYIDWWGSD